VPLVAITVVLFGSGFGLLLTGPVQPGPLLAMHNVSTLIWLPMIVIHALAYLRRLPPVITADLAWRPSSRFDGRRFRLGLNILALVAGSAAAIVVIPTDAPWVVWARTVQQVPAPLILGTIVAALAVVALRPWRWTESLDRGS
jgi:hypothetical protein